jgi:hypothetical protein
MNDRSRLDLTSDAALLQWLLSQDARPNILLDCGPGVDAVADYVTRLCAAPRERCRLPGALALPASKSGTLLLENVEQLTPPQQAALHEWMSTGCADVQIVSIAASPLAHLVQRGEFLEALFYRLNVIRLEVPASAVILRAGHGPAARHRVPAPRVDGPTDLPPIHTPIPNTRRAAPISAEISMPAES